jgi:hypothetical protein
MKRQIRTNLLIAVGIIACMLTPVLVAALRMELIYPWCSVDSRWDFVVPGDGGYSVSFYIRDCGFIGSTAEEGVFAERSRFPWPWPERKYIFWYRTPQTYSYAAHLIPTGPNSVTLSAEELSAVLLAETNWGALKIDYNIGSIEHPGQTDPKTVGTAWAERENALAENARRQGIRTSIKVIP